MKRIASFEVDRTCLLPGMYLSRQDAIALTRETLKFIAEYEGEIPGAAAAKMLPVPENRTESDLSYRKGVKNNGL